MKTKDVAGAEELFGEMKMQGAKPNYVTYNILMDLYSKARMADKIFPVLI